VCNSYELARGKTLYVRALGLHLALYRGHDGLVRALDAFCPHLGANMAVGGSVNKNNCLVPCPPPPASPRMYPHAQWGGGCGGNAPLCTCWAA
jgi:hypothetical protein